MPIVLFLLVAGFAAVWLAAIKSGKKITEVLAGDICKIVAITVVVRLAATLIPMTHPGDMGVFKMWSGWMYHDGPAQFYLHEGTADYPPGYLYLLWPLGALQSWFKLAHGGAMYTLLQKLPSILADAAAAAFLYQLGKKRIGAKAALAAGLLYALNPAVIVDSAVWGQVDAIHTLMLLASIYWLTEDKPLPAFALFGAALITKPQTLPFGLLYAYYAWDYVKTRNWRGDAVGRMCLAALAAAGVIFALILPFVPFAGGAPDFGPVYRQYRAMLVEQYPYASVNAYNFWALIGQNWGALNKQYWNMPISAWNYVAVAFSACAALWVLNRRKGKGDWFLAAGVLSFSVFMFMTKMHERYLFVAMAMFLAAYAYEPEAEARRGVRLAYVFISVVTLLNIVDVLRASLDGWNWALIAGTSRIFATLTAEAFVFTAYVVYQRLRVKREEPRYVFAEDKTERPARYARKDWIYMTAVTAAYAAVAFTNLGDTKAPQTYWPAESGQSATAAFDAPQTVSKIQVYLMYDHNKDLLAEFSDDGANWRDATPLHAESVFRWAYTDVPDVAARYVRITAESDNCPIGEIAFRDQSGALIPVTGQPAALFDEQATAPERYNYTNGTYFDEIYHPRTAYEYANNLGTTYEWTHPPLGKFIMSLGIRIFGMTPFGWRFMGTLFGVFMVPLMYALARRVLKDPLWAAFAAVLFAFDFMHFSQTRLATIDTYVTFFIIAMYYFMYQYYTASFYDTPLRKTLVPLGLSGLSFGLAVASKWPGLYAGAGLAVLFFATLYKRYREYQKIQEPKRRARYRALFQNNTLATLAACVGFFIIVPLVIYALSYIPSYAKPGVGLSQFLREIVNNQKSMWAYHAKTVLGSTHPYSSNWWEWVLDLRPIFYFLNRDGLPVGMGRGISAFGSPLLYLGGFAAIIWGAFRLTRKHDKTLAFLLIAYVTQLLPWVFVERLTFMYHYFPCVPFLTLIAAYACKNIPGLRTKPAIYALAAASVLLFIVYYPVLSGTPVDMDFVRKYLQLPFLGSRWQLI